MASPETVWIIGGGQFGLRAATLLKKESPESYVTLIDREPIDERTDSIETIVSDGAAWLFDNFTANTSVSKIIPAVPVHLAVYWLQRKLSAEGSAVHLQQVPGILISQFPNPFRIKDGSVVISYADFLCPPDCPEPDDICTYTGLPRPTPLYQYLETIDCGAPVKLILQSRQFADGVGGFYPEDLWGLLECARKFPGQPLLIATACKCHGVVSLLCPTGFHIDTRIPGR